MIHTFSSTIRRKEMDAVLTCMVDEKVGPGDISKRLIHTAGEFFGIEGVAALRSPSLALSFALQALDIPAESGIVISALAPAWHYAAVLQCGYKPVVIDVSPDTAHLPLESVTDAIKNGARLILLFEPLGSIPNMEPLIALGIPIIEDISQSAGSTFTEARAGTFGVFAILGLEEHDAITAGGGAVLLAAKKRDALPLKKLIEGTLDDSKNVLPPQGSRGALNVDLLPDINSALAFVQLKEFAKNETRRKELYDSYTEPLMQSRHKMIPVDDGCERAAYCFAVVLTSGYKDVKQYAAKRGIEIEQAFSSSVSNVYTQAAETCINARSLVLRTALFPLYPRLTNQESRTVKKVLSTLP
jgi:dTDP-4-amino-4,6-dideoxygalactose transaminase